MQLPIPAENCLTSKVFSGLFSFFSCIYEQKNNIELYRNKKEVFITFSLKNKNVGKRLLVLYIFDNLYM